MPPHFLDDALTNLGPLTSNESPASSKPSYHMPAIITNTDPISPRSAVNILIAEDDIPQDTLRELVTGLAATIYKREGEVHSKEAKLRSRIADLEDRLAEYDSRDEDEPPARVRPQH